MAKRTIPKNINEAFGLLDRMLTREDKEAIVTTSKSDFIVNAHFGLGLWIRNNWIYTRSESAGEGPLPAFLDTAFEHPDSVSSRILEKYYDHLKETQRAGDDSE